MALRALLALTAWLIFSAASLKLLPIPFVWIMLAGAVASVLLMPVTRSSALRATWLNLAIGLLTIGAAEAYFSYQAGFRVAPTYLPSHYQVKHDVLGVAPTPDVKAKGSLIVDGEPVYDVTYTIGADGLRVSPSPKAPSADSVVFFGCSFTFGEGLPDEQSMPYRVGVLAGGEYQVRNFGFHGYGAQQMFAALQSGLVDKMLDRPPSIVVYQALPDHVARAVGLHSYQANHPRYVLQNGELVRRGSFGDADPTEPPPGLVQANLLYQLRKSAIARLLLDGERHVTDEDEKLWLEMVVQSRAIVAQKFPNAEFHVLLWNFAGDKNDAQLELSEKMAADLHAAGIVVHSVSDMLPNYTEAPEQYQLSPEYDRHPKAIAHELIAQYVTREILGKGEKLARF